MTTQDENAATSPRVESSPRDDEKRRLPAPDRTRILALALVLFLPLLAAVKPPLAKWSFGVVSLKDAQEKGTVLYGTLKNLGGASDEKVLLYIVGTRTDVPAATDKPLQDISNLTKKVKTCVVQTTFALPEALATPTPPSYKLVLTVAGTVTDTLVVKDGQPAPPAPRPRAPQSAAPQPSK